MRKKRIEWEPYLYSTPFFILFGCFMILPFVLNIVLSFTNYSMANTVIKFVGFRNYETVFANGQVFDAIGKTLIFTAGCLTISMLAGIFYAVVMTFDIKGSSLLKAVVLLPWILPESVTAYVWKWLFSAETGMVHYLLLKIGLISEETSFFGDGALAMWMIILSNAWRTAPFVAIMVYAKLKSLPASQVEAAKVDGANAVQIFRKVTVPWILPIVKRLVILLFVWSFNSFSIIYIMTYGGPAGATTTLPFLIRQTAFKNYNFGQATTLGVLAFVIICVGLLSAKAAGMWYVKVKAGSRRRAL